MSLGRGNEKGRQELIEGITEALPQDMEKLSVMGLLQFGSSLLLKEAVRAEITRYLGRGFYEHLKQGKGFKWERNGYRKTIIDTPIGQIEYDRPLVSYAPDFESQFHTPYMRRPKAFANAISDMHVNGISTRNVKKALKSIVGKKARLSRSTISRITEKMKEEFKIWKKRDLSELKVVYLILDAIRVPMRIGGKGLDSVMVAYGVLEDGSFETISLTVKNSESDLAWRSFVIDMKDRGLKDPLLVVSDGNHGVVEGIDLSFPTSYRQRCVRHKTENILTHIPKDQQDGVRRDINRIFYGATSLEQAKIAIDDFIRKYRKIYPSAIDCLERDLAQCLTFYCFPQAHWQRIRTSNQVERLNLEIRRRLNSIGRHPSEEGCLALIFHVCLRHCEISRRFKATDLIKALWNKLRGKQDEIVIQLELDLKAA